MEEGIITNHVWKDEHLYRKEDLERFLERFNDETCVIDVAADLIRLRRSFQVLQKWGEDDSIRQRYLENTLETLLLRRWDCKVLEEIVEIFRTIKSTLRREHIELFLDKSSKCCSCRNNSCLTSLLQTFSEFVDLMINSISDPKIILLFLQLYGTAIKKSKTVSLVPILRKKPQLMESILTLPETSDGKKSIHRKDLKTFIIHYFINYCSALIEMNQSFHYCDASIIILSETLLSVHIKIYKFIEQAFSLTWFADCLLSQFRPTLNSNSDHSNCWWMFKQSITSFLITFLYSNLLQESSTSPGNFVSIIIEKLYDPLSSPVTQLFRTLLQLLSHDMQQNQEGNFLLSNYYHYVGERTDFRFGVWIGWILFELSLGVNMIPRGEDDSKFESSDFRRINRAGYDIIHLILVDWFTLKLQDSERSVILKNLIAKNEKDSKRDEAKLELFALFSQQKVIYEMHSMVTKSTMDEGDCSNQIELMLQLYFRSTAESNSNELLPLLIQSFEKFIKFEQSLDKGKNDHLQDSIGYITSKVVAYLEIALIDSKLFGKNNQQTITNFISKFLQWRSEHLQSDSPPGSSAMLAFQHLSPWKPFILAQKSELALTTTFSQSVQIILLYHVVQSTSINANELFKCHEHFYQSQDSGENFLLSPEMAVLSDSNPLLHFSVELYKIFFNILPSEKELLLSYTSILDSSRDFSQILDEIVAFKSCTNSSKVAFLAYYMLLLNHVSSLAMLESLFDEKVPDFTQSIYDPFVSLQSFLPILLFILLHMPNEGKEFTHLNEMFSYYSTKLEVHETLEEIDHFSTNPTQSPHTTQRTSSPALKNSPIRVKTSPTKIFSPLNLHSPPKIEKFTDSDKLKHSIQGSKEFFKRRYNTFIEKPVLSPLVCSLSFLKLSLDRLRSLFDPNNSKSTRSIKVAGYLQIRDAGFEVELLSLCFLLYQCSSGFYEINTNLALTYENHHPNPFTSLSQALLYNLFYRTSDASQRQVSMNSTRTNDNSFIEGFIQLINGSWEFYKLTGSITIPFSVPAAASNKCATYFREDKLDQKSPLFQYLHTKSKTTLNPNNSNPFSIPNPRMTLQLDMQQKLVSEHHPTLLFLPKACSVVPSLLFFDSLSLTPENYLLKLFDQIKKSEIYQLVRMEWLNYFLNLFQLWHDVESSCKENTNKRDPNFYQTEGTKEILSFLSKYLNEFIQELLFGLCHQITILEVKLYLKIIYHLQQLRSLYREVIEIIGEETQEFNLDDVYLILSLLSCLEYLESCQQPTLIQNLFTLFLSLCKESAFTRKLIFLLVYLMTNCKGNIKNSDKNKTVVKNRKSVNEGLKENSEHNEKNKIRNKNRSSRLFQDDDEDVNIDDFPFHSSNLSEDVIIDEDNDIYHRKQIKIKSLLTLCSSNCDGNASIPWSVEGLLGLFYDLDKHQVLFQVEDSTIESILKELLLFLRSEWCDLSLSISSDSNSMKDEKQKDRMNFTLITSLWYHMNKQLISSSLLSVFIVEKEKKNRKISSNFSFSVKILHQLLIFQMQIYVPLITKELEMIINYLKSEKSRNERVKLSFFRTFPFLFLTSEPKLLSLMVLLEMKEFVFSTFTFLQSESDVESFREGDGTEIDDPDKINKCAEESFGMDEIQMNRIRNYSKKIVKIEQLLFTLYDLLLLWYSSSRDVILPSNMEENREETTEFSLREMFDSLKDFLIRWNVDSFNQRYQEFARVAVSSSQGMESPERNQKLKTYSHSISPHTMSTSELIAIIRDKSKEEGDLKLGQNSSLLKRKFEREEKKGVNKTLSKGGKKQRIHVSEEASRKQNPPKLKNKNVIIQQWRKDDKELYDNYADLEDFLVVDQNED